MKLIKYAAAALIALGSLSANAGLISIVDSGSSQYAENIPADSTNDFITPGYITPGSYTIAGSLKANANLVVTYYFLGQESSWSNFFSVPGDAEAALSKSNKGTITTTVAKDSLFDFLFTSNIPATAVNPANTLSVTNAQGSVESVFTGRHYSFAAALNATFTGQGPSANAAHAGFYDAILFLDDTGPNAADDDNHDDLIIGVRVTVVPEPTTLLLMSMGLLGLFGARRLKA